MKFSTKAADLLRALDIVSGVTPKAITPQGGAGYLFKTYRDSEGNPRCHVYSRDSNEVARGDLQLLDLEGEGVFISPLRFLDGVKYLADDVISFETKAEGDAFTVSYTSSSGASQESASFDPKLITPIDRDFETASQSQPKVFPVGILRDAIGLSKRFLVDAKDNRTDGEHLKTLQIFDSSNEAWAKGDGTMFATNGIKAFFYYCEAFQSNGLAVHSAHLDRLVTFLSKCRGKVEIRLGERMAFAVHAIHGSDGKMAGEQIFGWAYHSKMHPKYGYYALKSDQFVLRLPKAATLNALNYTRTTLDANKDKIRMQFSSDKREVNFSVQDGHKKAGSFPVPVIDAQLAEAKDFACNVNIDHLIELVDGVKGNEVLLRIFALAPDDRRPKGAALIRTIDEFWMDSDGKVIGGSSTEKDTQGNEKRPEGGIKCRVTRFMPSKD